MLTSLFLKSQLLLGLDTSKIFEGEVDSSINGDSAISVGKNIVQSIQIFGILFSVACFVMVAISLTASGSNSEKRMKALIWGVSCVGGVFIVMHAYDLASFASTFGSDS